MYVSAGEFFGPDRRRREMEELDAHRRKRPFEYSSAEIRDDERD